MTYPRTPELHRGLGGAFRSNVSHGDARAQYSVDPGVTPPREATSAARLKTTRYDGHASSSTRSYDTWLRVLGAVFSSEIGLAYGFTDRVAIETWLSTELAGLELRLQLLSQREGAPFSATLALGGAHVGIFPSMSKRMLREGFGARAGLDLGFAIGRNQLLVGGYASQIRRRRNFQSVPDDGAFRETWPGFSSGLMVVRDETKLSVPIGFAVRAQDVAIVSGIVPEWTLHASLSDWSCPECSYYQLDRFDQSFAIYLTFGIEAWPEASDKP
jgi:hypothetical protein